MGFNLSEWALRNRQIVLFLMILLAVVGTLSYTKLGQSEDPPFTFKAMVIKTNWPGATAQEVSRQVTERIEKKLMETGVVVGRLGVAGDTPDTSLVAVVRVFVQVQERFVVVVALVAHQFDRLAVATFGVAQFADE